MPFLPVRDDFHPKRNQARQKLATLPTGRFKDLSSDVYYELGRRYPEFKEEATVCARHIFVRTRLTAVSIHSHTVLRPFLPGQHMTTILLQMSARPAPQLPHAIEHPRTVARTAGMQAARRRLQGDPVETTILRVVGDPLKIPPGGVPRRENMADGQANQQAYTVTRHQQRTLKARRLAWV